MHHLCVTRCRDAKNETTNCVSPHISSPSPPLSLSLSPDNSPLPSPKHATNSDEANIEFTRHPGFPDLPADVPLTYALTMHACLCELPGDRPTFSDVVTLLDDTCAEVASGSYLNLKGTRRVRPCCQANVPCPSLLCCLLKPRSQSNCLGAFAIRMGGWLPQNSPMFQLIVAWPGLLTAPYLVQYWYRLMIRIAPVECAQTLERCVQAVEPPG
jgi:hypothetical protein